MEQEWWNRMELEWWNKNASFSEASLPMVEGQSWSYWLCNGYQRLAMVTDINDPILNQLKNSGNDLVEKRLAEKIKELTITQGN